MLITYKYARMRRQSFLNSITAAMVLYLAAGVIATYAADNLTCAGPYGRTQGTPISNGSVDLSSGHSGTICVDVPAGKEIVGLKCNVTDKHRGPPFDHYYCPLGASCGIGIFSNALRKPSARSGMDSICVDYHNSGPGNQTAGLRVNLR